MYVFKASVCNLLMCLHSMAKTVIFYFVFILFTLVVVLLRELLACIYYGLCDMGNYSLPPVLVECSNVVWDKDTVLCVVFVYIIIIFHGWCELFYRIRQGFRDRANLIQFQYIAVHDILHNTAMIEVEHRPNLELNHWPLGDFNEILDKKNFSIVLVIYGWSTYCAIALSWISLDRTESTLVLVMAWCRQTTSHCLTQ